MAVDVKQTGETLLRALAEEVKSWPETGEARGRQTVWVAGEYGRALTMDEHPLTEEAAADDLFRREAIDTYLTLAADGKLRDPHRSRTGKTKTSPDTSRHVRIQVLELLAHAAGVVPELPPKLTLTRKRPVPPRQRELLRRRLTEVADRADASPGRVRMLAIGGTVADTAARAGEMCSRTIEDLSPTLEELRILRRPQGRAEDEAYIELAQLSQLTRSALRRWLEERLGLLAHTGGAATALWVALHPNHHGDRKVPPGTPLRPRGLARAWNDAVNEVNELLAGEPGWEPLPTRMEQLRRGVKPATQLAPRRPDAERAATLLAAVRDAGRQLAAVREAELDTTVELAARVAVRRAVRAAWAEGIEHRVQLDVLAGAGIVDRAALAAAGWEPTLLAAIDRAAGHGRPSKRAAA